MPAGVGVLPLAAGLDAENADWSGAAVGCDSAAAGDGAAGSAGARCSMSTGSCTVHECHCTATKLLFQRHEGRMHADSRVQRNDSAVLWQAADLAAPVGAGFEHTAHHRHAPLAPVACMHVKASSTTLAGPMSISMHLHVRLYPWAANAHQKKRLSVPLQWNARIRAPGRGTLSTRAAVSVSSSSGCPDAAAPMRLLHRSRMPPSLA